MSLPRPCDCVGLGLVVLWLSSLTNGQSTSHCFPCPPCDHTVKQREQCGYQARTEYSENEFIPFQNRLYWVSLIPLNPLRADEFCRELGARLLSVESYMEDAFVTSLMWFFNRKYGFDYRTFWTSGHSNADGQWVWATGKAISYTRWVGNTIQTPRQGQNIMYLTPKQGWSISSRENKFPFICEKKAGSDDTKVINLP